MRNGIRFAETNNKQRYTVTKTDTMTSIGTPYGLKAGKCTVAFQQEVSELRAYRDVQNEYGNARH